MGGESGKANGLSAHKLTMRSQPRGIGPASSLSLNVSDSSQTDGRTTSRDPADTPPPAPSSLHSNPNRPQADDLRRRANDHTSTHKRPRCRKRMLRKLRQPIPLPQPR